MEETAASKNVITTWQAAQKARKEALAAQEAVERFVEENEQVCTYVRNSRY